MWQPPERIKHELPPSAWPTAEQAAGIILDGVSAGRWRILVGEDAQRLDAAVRQDPENAYEKAFIEAVRLVPNR